MIKKYPAVNLFLINAVPEVKKVLITQILSVLLDSKIATFFENEFFEAKVLKDPGFRQCYLVCRYKKSPYVFVLREPHFSYGVSCEDEHRFKWPKLVLARATSILDLNLDQAVCVLNTESNKEQLSLMEESIIESDYAFLSFLDCLSLNGRAVFQKTSIFADILVKSVVSLTEKFKFSNVKLDYSELTGMPPLKSVIQQLTELMSRCIRESYVIHNVQEYTHCRKLALAKDTYAVAIKGAGNTEYLVLADNTCGYLVQLYSDKGSVDVCVWDKSAPGKLGGGFIKKHTTLAELVDELNKEPLDSLSKIEKKGLTVEKGVLKYFSSHSYQQLQSLLLKSHSNVQTH